MKLFFRAPALLLLARLACAQTPDPLRATHDGLFAAFIPIRENADKLELVGAFTAAREGIWRAAGQETAFRGLLTPLSDLRSFGAACGIADLVESAHESVFAKLAPAQQVRAIYLLLTCSSNPPRRLAMGARNFYIVQTYGALQEKLTGVNLKLYAPDAYIKEHQPRLPASRLRYDAAKKTISREDGEIDYL